MKAPKILSPSAQIFNWENRRIPVFHYNKRFWWKFIWQRISRPAQGSSSRPIGGLCKQNWAFSLSRKWSSFRNLDAGQALVIKEDLVGLQCRKHLQALSEPRKVFGGNQTLPGSCARSELFEKRMDLTKLEPPPLKMG